jgi:hypothetical protein
MKNQTSVGFALSKDYEGDEQPERLKYCLFYQSFMRYFVIVCSSDTMTTMLLTCSL